MSTEYHLLGSPKPPSHNLRLLAQYPPPLHHRYRKGFQSPDPRTGQGVFQLSERLDYRVPVFCGFLAFFFPPLFRLRIGYRTLLFALSWVWISVASWDALYDHDDGGSFGRVITGDIAVLHLSLSSFLLFSFCLYVPSFTFVSMYYYYYRTRI